jgi:hypothetical protein
MSNPAYTENYLKTNKFRPHHMGNYALFGINMFGCSSIISYKEVDGTVDVWKFLHCGPCGGPPVYFNSQGIRRTFDFGSSDVYNRATRLEDVNDRPEVPVDESTVVVALVNQDKNFILTTQTQQEPVVAPTKSSNNAEPDEQVENSKNEIQTKNSPLIEDAPIVPPTDNTQPTPPTENTQPTPPTENTPPVQPEPDHQKKSCSVC